MSRNPLFLSSICLAFVVLGGTDAHAKRSSKKTEAPSVELTDAGKQLEAKYAAMLSSLKTEIERSLPAVDGQKLSAVVKSREAAKAAQEKFASSGNEADRVKTLKTAMGFWKKFGVHQSEQRIEKAQADLKAATTDAQRDAAKKELAKWHKSKEEAETKIRNGEAEIAQLTPQVADSAKAKESAKAALDRALANEADTAKAFVSTIEPFLSGDKLDTRLVKCALLNWATPAGLAKFAEAGREKAALVDQLLADDKLMKDMLMNGGAMHGKFAQAMEIYTTIQKASPKAGEGMFQRLALGVALELAEPIPQQSDKHHVGKSDDAFDAADDVKTGVTVDPVKRYLSYEQAWLKGDLDPAFKTFTPWEYRLVINSMASNEVLEWGRQVIRNYRPDYVTTKKNGWSYSSLVKSDVGYGSDKCKFDRPDLNQYQNILKDGGVCGRRATFGRFILLANGIPVWGVTQHKHAALSRWTPKGWVVNLGAGFNNSWWDKGDVPMSGTDFLSETQARRHPDDHIKVLRAQWISRVLGEQAYSGRRNIAGCTWSSIGHYLQTIIASKEVELGPLGEELAEASTPEDKDDVEKSDVGHDDQKVEVAQAGQIIIPAVAHGKATGTAIPMKSIGSAGMQILGSTGFKADYEFTAPKPGKYVLSAKVVAVHDGHKIALVVNGAKAVDVPVAYTGGYWQQTPPLEVTLNQGRNTIHFEITSGFKTAIKEFSLSPVK